MNNFFKYKFILAFFFLAVSYGQMNHSVKFDYMSGYAVSNASSESIFGDNYQMVQDLPQMR